MNEIKKTKVAFISIFSYTLFNEKSNLAFGGAEVQISLISKELARDNDFDVSVVVADTGQGDIEIYDNVKVIKSYKRGRGLVNLIKAPFQLYKTLKKINPDVVVCRAAGVEVGISAAYAKLNKKKFVYSIAHVNDLNGKRFKGLRGKIFKLGFNLADKYIAQSEDQKKTLEKNTKKNISIIKNSFNYIENSYSEFNSESKKINKKYILWVGRSVAFKRPEIFLKVAKEYLGLNFLMILQKTDIEMWKRLKVEANKLNNLKFIESVPFKEMDGIYRNASLFVNTSIEEGFPNTFIQSSMFGIPIVSLKVNPDNFLHKYECGISCGDDYEKLKGAIVKITSNEEYSNELGENAKKYFKENHDIKNNILKWKRIIKK